MEIKEPKTHRKSTLSKLIQYKQYEILRARWEEQKSFLPKSFVHEHCSNDHGKPNYLARLKSFVDYEQYSVLYNSNKNEWSTREFNSSICGHENVMVIIITEDNNVYGCHQQDCMRPSNPYHSINVESENNFFLFALNSEHSFKVNRHQENNKTVTLSSNNNASILFSCYSAFWITLNNEFRINPSLYTNYQIPKSSSPFPHEYCKSSIKQVLCVEWY